MRIDQLLVERGLAASRSQAQRLIAAGVQWRTPPGALPTAVVEAVKSSVEWRKINKNKDEVPSDAEIVLLDDSESKYVSRGGLKLEGALRDSGVSVSGLRCMDVGQSTGGFTECLLLNGAAEVVGIDVGHGQVHPRVREDARVICIEGVNARELMPDDERIPDAEAGFDVMVGDVSFISLTLVLPGVVPFLKPGGSTLLFLPVAHVFGRMVQIGAITAGLHLAHCSDPVGRLPADLASFKPSFVLAVPRIFEKIYNGAEAKADAAGKGKIFRKAAYTAIAYSKSLDTAEGPALGLKLQHAIFDVLVYKKLRAAMGGRVKYAVSGGGPLGARLGHFYRAIGLTVLEGYGLTETTAPVSIGRPDNLRIGKVGLMLPGTGIKIADDGEILLRGNNILRGYWRNPEATAAAFDGEWFKSGDIGEIDEEGFISITGRKKELIVTAGGKNVAPATLEDPLRANPLVGQAVVIGDQRPFVSALISLDPEMLPIWLSNNGLDKGLTLAQAAKEPKVLAEIQNAVDRVNKNFSKAESIRKFTIIGKELTEKSGHLTPSLKIKREIVLRDFAPAVEDIYQAGPATGEIIS